MKRQVKGKTGPTKPTKKVPKGPPSEPSDRYLVWRFGKMDWNGDFGCDKLGLVDAPELEQELAAFQAEPIWSLRKKNWLKFISVQDMTTEGRQRLAEVNQQEDGLWQLHLNRYKWRVWGYFEDPEFSFVWWDSDHGVATGKSRNRKT